MLDYTTLGSERIALLAADTDSKHKEALYPKVSVDLPGSYVKALEGSIKRIPMSFRRPKPGDAGPIGMNEDTPEGEVKIAGREYEIQRFSRALAYNKKLSGDALFNQVTQELLPMTQEQVSFDIDVIPLTIMAGGGSADKSRDVTTVDQTGDLFSDDATDILGILGDGAENTGADFGFFSTDMIRTFQKHKQFREQSKSGIAARASISAVVEVLMDHVGLREVVVGNRIYQSGSEYFALNVQRQASGICYIAPKTNLMRLPWQGLESDEYEDKPKNKVSVRTEAYMDFIIADKDLSRSYTNAI